MTAIQQREEGVLSLPTPLARLYGVALQIGIRVTDGCPQLWDEQDEENFSEAAAIVSFPDTVCLNPGLEGDDLRADVLAMALATSYLMGRGETGHAADISACTIVLISRTRVAEPPPGPGTLATMIAREHGRDTASAAFEYIVPAIN